MTWAVPEANVAPGLPAQIEGLTRADFDAYGELLPDTSFSIRSGGVGKGASGAGATLVMVLERVINDTASLIAVGVALRHIIERIRAKRGSDPIVTDPVTLAALAVAGADDTIRERLAGCVFRQTLPLTVSLEQSVGTDDRDVWVSCFANYDVGFVVAIFISPSGLVLGTSIVPSRRGIQDGEYRERTPAEIAAWNQRAG